MAGMPREMIITVNRRFWYLWYRTKLVSWLLASLILDQNTRCVTSKSCSAILLQTILIRNKYFFQKWAWHQCKNHSIECNWFSTLNAFTLNADSTIKKLLKKHRYSVLHTLESWVSYLVWIWIGEKWSKHMGAIEVCLRLNKRRIATFILYSGVTFSVIESDMQDQSLLKKKKKNRPTMPNAHPYTHTQLHKTKNGQISETLWPKNKLFSQFCPGTQMHPHAPTLQFFQELYLAVGQILYIGFLYILYIAVQ